MRMETETTAKLDLNPLLTELRSIIDQREQLARQDKELSERRSAIERQLLDFHHSSGLDSLSGGGLGVGFDPTALRAKYEPEQWNNIAQWAVATHNEHIIQRRLSDAKIVELIDSGVELPAGLSVEQYVKISIRRK
jgi:hypothetical protein